MAVASPDLITAAFEAAYNARNKAALMDLYAEDAVHTFDGRAVSNGIDAISAAFDRGFAGSVKLQGQTLTCLVAGDTALLRVRWQGRNSDGSAGAANISCEVLRRGTDGLWRYCLDDATGGSRAAGG